MKQHGTLRQNPVTQSVPPERIADFLGETPLLRQVQRKQLLSLAAKARVISFPKGSVIFRIGDQPNWLYFLYKGYITECVAYGSSMNIIVKTRKKHDYIGEMGILSGRPYPNTAMAMGDAVLIAFSKEALLDMLEMHYSVSQYIILELIDRLTGSAKKLVNTMYLDAPARLAFTIVSLSSDMAGNHHDISVTQNELAAASGTARQTVAKILGEWRKEGYIQTERGKLSLINPDALLEIITQYEINR